MSMQREVIVFTSPNAGNGAAREQIPRLIELIGNSGRNLRCQVVADSQQLVDLTADRRRSGLPQPVVVAAGGDGTLSLVASLTRSDTPLIPMPMGTENLLARYFGQSNDAEAVLRTLLASRSFQMDAGMANGRLFLIMASAGFDAEVVRRLHLRRRGHISRLSYLAPILRTIGRYRFPPVRVRCWDESDELIDDVSVGWAMAFNLPCYAASLRIEPDARSDDGQMDLITFGGRSVLSGLRYIAGIAGGRHRGFADVKRRRVARVRIEAERRVAFQLDGDYAGRLPLEIKVLPKRIRLLLPPGYTRVISEPQTNAVSAFEGPLVAPVPT
ncbi:protein BmrU [Roseiconus nitratireducens]|uniref:Protein BmrU n=1 Tax=Roseiconus nitratireducens TaxID=2605748 RepID=A0A5M6D0L4_9BACT|nr:diacylglycerol kinase family protein [Roseiconus nitratireducens]KAA5540230.1 protein BmrU [Roseiconus nitratireducens]